MSKILSATCVNNTVTCESAAVPSVTVLSEGVASSSGILILEDDKKTYVAKTSPDLKTALGLIATALQDAASALTTLDTMSTATASIAAITAGIVQINFLKENLK